MKFLARLRKLIPWGRAIPCQMTTGRLYAAALEGQAMPRSFRDEVGLMIREFHHVAPQDSDR